jgi:hypothetical protein
MFKTVMQYDRHATLINVYKRHGEVFFEIARTSLVQEARILQGRGNLLRAAIEQGGSEVDILAKKLRTYPVRVEVKVGSGETTLLFQCEDISVQVPHPLEWYSKVTSGKSGIYTPTEKEIRIGESSDDWAPAILWRDGIVTLEHTKLVWVSWKMDSIKKMVHCYMSPKDEGCRRVQESWVIKDKCLKVYGFCHFGVEATDKIMSWALRNVR